MKYIVMRVQPKNSTLTMEVPFLFPELLVHSMIAEHMTAALAAHFPESTIEPISAGFVSSFAAEDECYGKSDSLKLESRPEDGRLISMCDYGSMYT